MQNNFFNSGIAKWSKIGTYTYEQFAVNGFTSTISTGFTLPDNQIILGAFLVIIPEFSTFDSPDTYTISIGSARGNDVYLTATDVTGSTIIQPSNLIGTEFKTGDSAITITATSTIAKLNTAVRGTATLYLLLSDLPM
jgi:hypothetical protein